MNKEILLTLIYFFGIIMFTISKTQAIWYVGFTFFYIGILLKWFSDYDAVHAKGDKE